MKNVVVIGGGHGLSTILGGLKQINDINIAAIVTVADDGGSTGRLRTRYTIPAMGDIRNVMLSLSNSKELMRELMNYRFEGEDNMDIAGHSLGNLILTALTNMTGSFDDAIKEMSEVLKVQGKIIPSTLESVSLFARMEDDTIVKGEANIPKRFEKVKKVFYDHDVLAHKDAIEAIEKADYIIYSIGSLYTSVLPNLIISGIRDAVIVSRATKIYFANSMTQSNETPNYDIKDHVDALMRHGIDTDLIIHHNNEIPLDILKKYECEGAIEVKNNHNTSQEVIESDLLDFSKGLVRHDKNKIRDCLRKVLK